MKKVEVSASEILLTAYSVKNGNVKLCSSRTDLGFGFLRVCELFDLLKEASDLYASYGDVDGEQDPVVNKKRGNIQKDCQFIIDELEENGVDPAFSLTFLCYGDAFLIKEMGKTFTECKKGL